MNIEYNKRLVGCVTVSYVSHSVLHPRPAVLGSQILCCSFYNIMLSMLAPPVYYRVYRTLRLIALSTVLLSDDRRLGHEMSLCERGTLTLRAEQWWICKGCPGLVSPLHACCAYPVSTQEQGVRGIMYILPRHLPRLIQNHPTGVSFV